MDQRTRERLPILPALIAATGSQRQATAERLAAAQAAAPGAVFTAAGQTLRRTITTRAGVASVWAENPEGGPRRNLTREERRAFWAWAAVEVLRMTGLRVEELTELTHHSLVQYRLPGTGELIPLLHIVPSKTDTERLLVVSPELADVLSAIICRIRDDAGAVPLAVTYDYHERVYGPPMPILFQHRVGLENRQISAPAIRKLLDLALADTGLTGTAGQPLRLIPHDFRRIFITDAVMNGMPPHIAQLVAGHADINTTMGYKAVYPEEAINGHRAFLARRRALRPGGEYRLPTDEEWEEFLGHFARRKVALGDCGRAYGTSCIHEHSCVRCPLLRPDPAQRPRLAGLCDNLQARIDEAQREGWLGEAEGLKVSLAAARHKLAQLDDLARRRSTIHLGMPGFPGIASRTVTTPASSTHDSRATPTFVILKKFREWHQRQPLGAAAGGEGRDRLHPAGQRLRRGRGRAGAAGDCDSLARAIGALLDKWLRSCRTRSPMMTSPPATATTSAILQAEFSLTQVLDPPVTGRIFLEQLVATTWASAAGQGQPDLRPPRPRGRKQQTPGQFRTRVITERHPDGPNRVQNEGQAVPRGRQGTAHRDRHQRSRRLRHRQGASEPARTAAVGLTANRRLLGVQKISHDPAAGAARSPPSPAPSSPPPEPAIPGLRFTDERVQALLRPCAPSAAAQRIHQPRTPHPPRAPPRQAL